MSVIIPYFCVSSSCFTLLLCFITTWDSAVLGADTIPFRSRAFISGFIVTLVSVPRNSFIRFQLNSFLMSSFTKPQSKKLIILHQRIVKATLCCVVVVHLPQWRQDCSHSDYRCYCCCSLLGYPQSESRQMKGNSYNVCCGVTSENNYTASSPQKEQGSLLI